MKKLPVYFLVETSVASLGRPAGIGEKIIRNALEEWSFDPFALELIHLSIITFDNEARVFLPMTDFNLVKDELKPVYTSFGLKANLGPALKLLAERILTEVKNTDELARGDFEPFVFLIICSRPADDWSSALEEFKTLRFNVLACLITNPKPDPKFLEKLTPDRTVVDSETLDRMDQGRFFGSFMRVLDKDDVLVEDKKTEYPWIL